MFVSLKSIGLVKIPDVLKLLFLLLLLLLELLMRKNIIIELNFAKTFKNFIVQVFIVVLLLLDKTIIFFLSVSLLFFLYLSV